MRLHLGSPPADHHDRAMRSKGLLDTVVRRVYHRLEGLADASPAEVEDIVRDVYLLGLYAGHVEAEIAAGAFDRGAPTSPGLTHYGAAAGLIATSKILHQQIARALRLRG